MASFNLLLAIALAVLTQKIDAVPVAECADIDICFHDAVRKMDANLNELVLDIIDTLEPKYQIIRITVNDALEHGTEELNAVEKGALSEVDDLKTQAEGNVGHCLKNEIKIKLLTKEAHSASARCVDSTLDSVDSIFDIGVLELYHLRKAIDEFVLEFSMCVSDDCKKNVFGRVNLEKERIILNAYKISEETSSDMENAIPGIEDRCMSAHRQALRIKLRDIVDDMQRCIQNTQ